MSDADQIVREQIEWWSSQGYTPRDALSLLTAGRGAWEPRLLTWERVYIVALERYQGLQRHGQARSWVRRAA